MFLPKETLRRTVAEIESTQLAEEDIHMACVGVTSPDDSPSSGKDDQDILETEKCRLPLG
jgi:hypothetical protein